MESLLDKEYNILQGTDDGLVAVGTLKSKTFKSGKFGYTLGFRIADLKKALSNASGDWINFMAFEKRKKEEVDRVERKAVAQYKKAKKDPEPWDRDLDDEIPF